MVSVLCQHELRIVAGCVQVFEALGRQFAFDGVVLGAVCNERRWQGRIGGDVCGVAPCTAELGVFVQVDATDE